MSALSEDDKANLVAYLDGELDEEATQAMEARLSQDPAARAELASLKQVYGLLDYLPRHEPSDSFTHRTMQRLAIPNIAKKTGKIPVAAGLRGWRIFAWIVGIALFMAAGFVSAPLIWPVKLPSVEPPTPAAKTDTLAEWLAQQPKAIRDKAAALPAQERVAFVAVEKGRSRKTQEDWLIASRFWTELHKGAPLPARPSDFPESVGSYVQDYLRHFLSKEEWARLQQAQGQWPLFPMTLVELADKHPPALPGPHGHRRFDELPFAVQKMFKSKTPGGKAIKAAEGNWPGFARALTQTAQTRGLHFPNELWPYNYKGLNPEMKEFVDKLMTQVLSEEQKHQLLNKTPSRWPDYPLAVQELARAHRLEPPWFVLPGSREMWEKYRLRR